VFVLGGNIEWRGVGFSGLVGELVHHLFGFLDFIVSWRDGGRRRLRFGLGFYFTQGLHLGSVWRSGSWFFLRYLSYLFMGWFWFGKASGKGAGVFDVVPIGRLGALLSRQTQRVCQDTECCDYWES